MSKILQVQKLKHYQFEVIRRFALGQRPLEIAKALGMSPMTVKTISRKPESREYLTNYLELLDLISDIAQANQTLEALQANQDLLTHRADMKELIDFTRNLMNLTGKKKFFETISRLKQAAQKLIENQAA